MGTIAQDIYNILYILPDFDFRINLMPQKVLTQAKVLMRQGAAALVRNSRYAAEIDKLRKMATRYRG
jgi:hypothetical protein